MEVPGYTNEQSLVADVVKEFKARGSFDQLRKEIYSEIIAQRSFQNLNKSIDEFVSSSLADRQNVNLRKNDMRDMIRRRLYDHNSFNNQINYLIAQTLDQKKSTCLRPIIETTCDSICKPPTTPSSSQPTDTSTNPIKQEPVTTPEPSNKTPLVPSTHTPLKQKVTVEDFLISNETKPPVSIATHHPSPPKLEKSKSNTDLDKQLHQTKTATTTTAGNIPAKKDEKQTIAKQISKSDDKSVKHAEVVKQVKGSSQQGVMVKKKDTTTTTSQTSGQSAITTTSDLIRRRLSITTSETNLDADPTNEYNFEWNLNQIDAHLLDDVSVSSVSDLSDLEELTLKTE